MTDGRNHPGQPGPSPVTPEPAQTFRVEICQQCLNPIHAGEGICLACGTSISTSDSIPPTASSVGPTTVLPSRPAPSRNRPVTSSTENDKPITGSPPVICDESLRLGVQFSVDPLWRKKLRSAWLRSNSYARGTSLRGTTVKMRPATLTSSNGFTPTARRYLHSRHSVLWGQWNLADSADFERAVEWLAGVFAEAFAPEPDLP